MPSSLLMPPTDRADAPAVVIRPIRPPADRAAFRAVVAARPGGFALESLAADSSAARFSYFGVVPLRVVSVPAGDDPFPTLARHVRAMPRVHRAPHTDIPFIGGWVGYLAYEAGGWLEPRARPTRLLSALPSAWFAFYDAVLAADHATGRWYAAGFAIDGDADRLNRRIDELEALAAGANRPTPSAPNSPASTELPDRDMTRAGYVERVRRALDYVAAGDIFQVNLAQRFTVRSPLPTPALYERLCRANPASFAAWISGSPRWAVLSSSPELFLELRGRRVLTRPIKGTRPRGATPAADAAARAALAGSEKDAAELAMIVDLERNDLGRVCRYGSVRVDDPGSIETLPTVHHRVATVSGELRPDCDAIDLLRAAFPGGSITGAPKVRAMQIIDELECSPRGPYCGAIGYIGADGDLMLNLAIRTLVATPHGVHLSVGSGIVADSQPDREYDETLAKAAGMLKALRVGTGE